MSFFKDMFLGVTIADMSEAKRVCEHLLGATLKCTNSMFYGGDHCHAVIEGSSFDLRLNHHDDGWGWSWCVKDERYPLVLSCTFRSEAQYHRILQRLETIDAIEVPLKFR
ncbi:MAG: hypothetical protein ACKVP7_27405 [Hyphomicrobiaceae bacterium]